MHTGKVKKMIRDKGFGFISATDGREIFFHRSGVDNDGFDNMSEGQEVTFEVEKGQKGPCAVNIRNA